ncbi:MAG: biotin/lipoyl-containing protein [Myxococcaceae bacterium]
MPSVRYLATLRGHTEQVAVEVEELPNGLLLLTVDGQRHEVDALALEHGAVSLLLDGQVYDVEFDDVGQEVQVLVRGDAFCVDVADERALRLRAGAAAFQVEGKVTLAAPMPGKVVRLLVKQGEAVQEGQGLVVVEAMKMENELKSPKAGTVTEVFAQEGRTVEAHAKLLTVE